MTTVCYTVHPFIKLAEASFPDLYWATNKYHLVFQCLSPKKKSVMALRTLGFIKYETQLVG